MRHIFLALATVLIVSSAAYAAGDLLRTPGGIFNQTAIQKFAPTSVQSKTLGTKGYANFSTTSLTAVRFQGLNSTTGTAVKVRVGGFVTGNETDWQTEGATPVEAWIGLNITKIGFKAVSSANSITVNVQKQ